MGTSGHWIGVRWDSQVKDVRAARLFCEAIGYMAGTLVVPTAVVALVRHPGTRGEFAIGCGLAVVMGLLLAMVGMVSGANVAARDRVPVRSRWFEAVGGVCCFVVLVVGMRMLAHLGLGPAGVTLGVLVVTSLGLVLLLIGMLSTLVQLARVLDSES